MQENLSLAETRENIYIYILYGLFFSQLNFDSIVTRVINRAIPFDYIILFIVLFRYCSLYSDLAKANQNYRTRKWIGIVNRKRVFFDLIDTICMRAFSFGIRCLRIYLMEIKIAVYTVNVSRLLEKRKTEQSFSFTSVHVCSSEN